MISCPFCILNHKHKIYESDKSFVIYNIRPGKNKGRCVVIPKRHVTNIRELSEEEIFDLIKIVQKVSVKLSNYLHPLGFNYGWNEGIIAGQTIDHIHFHIMPRYDNDGLSKHHLFHRNPKDSIDLSDEELQPLVEEFKSLLNK
jgi:diadenosine tetraphosphate (Ap4A) HIT family hydrolase